MDYHLSSTGYFDVSFVFIIIDQKRVM